MSEQIFEWAIVGAGPAGIAAVGKLIDAGVKPTSILWIDEEFNVGDLGRFWQNVSSNTTVKLFTRFMEAAASFSYKDAPDFPLNHMTPEKTCALSAIVEPLQWVSNHLCKKVHIEKTRIQRMALTKGFWSLDSKTASYHSKKVILATGAIPISLDYPTIPTIDFETAIDKHQLAKAIKPQETYAVFGSSHSAIMIIKHLVELKVKKIINIYRSPCRYAVDMGDWILFDNTGLKGNTAIWAKEHIDGTLPDNLIRHVCNEEQAKDFLSQCDKAIYAVGFTPRDTIKIEGYDHKHYNPHVGIIGPGLFGLGIGFPEIKADPFGNIEARVGLWKFMVYLNTVLPLWFKYHT